MGAGLRIEGDFAALELFARQAGELKELPRLVALGSVGRLEGLTDAEFGAAADPYGNPWVPAKEPGATPLADGAGNVEVTAFGEGKIRAEALYPYNFHHTGTRSVGRKTAEKKLTKAIRAGFLGAMSKAEKRAQAKAISAASNVHDPKRPIVPDDARGTPPAWGDVLAEVSADVFAKAVT